MKTLVYDLEIKLAIPSSDPPVPGIEYCRGWSDYPNMGISVCAWTWLDGAATVFDWDQLMERDRFIHALGEADILSGFNSAGFDDHLLAANGIAATTNYDILYECRMAAYGAIDYRLQPKGHSYKLAAIVAANSMIKTGRGDLAPIWWQQGERDKVRSYCLNDVEIERSCLLKLLGERLINPNTGEVFQPRPLAPYAY